jgi:hypothetical protein
VILHRIQQWYFQSTSPWSTFLGINHTTHQTSKSRINIRLAMTRELDPIFFTVLDNILLVDFQTAEIESCAKRKHLSWTLWYKICDYNTETLLLLLIDLPAHTRISGGNSFSDKSWETSQSIFWFPIHTPHDIEGTWTIEFRSIRLGVPILIQVQSNHHTSTRNKCLQVTQFSLTGDIPRSFWRLVMLLSTRLTIRKVNSGIDCIKVMSQVWVTKLELN